jgi:predicted GH43/DUF377 family glycosyl hydrolase
VGAQVPKGEEEKDRMGKCTKPSKVKKEKVVCVHGTKTHNGNRSTAPLLDYTTPHYTTLHNLMARWL